MLFISVVVLHFEEGVAGEKIVGDSVVTFKLYMYNMELPMFRHLSSVKVLLDICALGLKKVLALYV